MARILNHPILTPQTQDHIPFTFEGRELTALPGEMISSALFAAGIRVFGHHPKDGAPQGIYCANGQCSQCMVLVDGQPVKACMTPVSAGMQVQPMNGLPELTDVPSSSSASTSNPIEVLQTEVLILGGGPAGLSAAEELGQHGAKVLLVDDKATLGGKLVLQTHRFFGSVNAVHAGTRGIDIGKRLAANLAELETVQTWLDSTALAVFSDRKVGILKGDRYLLVEPEVLLVATGAREKSLTFPGNTLPGVYGAGAFQTLVNRDLVRAANRLFIVGGGNVGLIAGYHALQAGIDVVGLVEALPQCGGYKVHRDKLARMGVPIYTSHTVLAADGDGCVETVTIAEIDENFGPIPGTERSFACDTLLIAVGLDPVDEFARAGAEYGLRTYSAGDAEEIAEASAAIFSGRITGRRIALELGLTDEAIPEEWARTAEILKSKPGEIIARKDSQRPDANAPHSRQDNNGQADTTSRASETRHRGDDSRGTVTPVFHCAQEIPCNPCTSVCPQGLIHIDPADIRGIPEFLSDVVDKSCIGCTKCLTICPGLAVTLVDARKDAEAPQVLIPYEFSTEQLREGDAVVVLDIEGEVLGTVPVIGVAPVAGKTGTALVRVAAPREIAERIAGIRVQESWVGDALPETLEPLSDQAIVCRCERVFAGEIRALIQEGLRDMNQIKAITRAGMGACGGKTCDSLIHRIFREEGIAHADIIASVPRPLFVEVPLSAFAGHRSEEGGAHHA